MINEKLLKLSENELENIHGTGAYKNALCNFGRGTARPIVLPIAAAKIVATGKGLNGEDYSRTDAAGYLFSTVLIIASTAVITYFAPTIYRKIKNAINK